LENKVLKRAIIIAVAASLPWLPGLQAAETFPTSPVDAEAPAYGPEESEEEIHVTEVKPEVKQVGKAASEGMSAATLKQIQNISLAAGIVAIAVTILVLVNNHHSHHKNHHKSQ
jgi:hypothetical protein